MRPDWRTAPAPSGWEHCRLIDLMDLPQGQVDPRQEPYRSMVLVAPDHIESNTGRLIGKETAMQQGAISGKYTFRPGTVLYSKIRPYLRKATLADFEGLCSADMYPLCPQKDVTDPSFLLALVLSEHFSRFAEIVSTRSGFPKINRQELAEYTTARPPLPEQRRMAEVLDTLDDTILKTEQLIAKLKQMKQGLLHDLLTRGINENGELRDSERTPESFSESPIGRVPRDWQFGILEHWLAGAPKNGYSPQPVSKWTGRLMLGLGCLTPEGFSPLQLKNAPKFDNRLRVASLRDGDFLLSRSNTRELVGLAGTYSDVGHPCFYPDLMMRLEPLAQRTSSRFMELVLRSEPIRRQIQASASGTSGSMVKISGAIVRRLQVAFPPPAEQGRIMAVHQAASDRIASEMIEHSKLRLLKQGLMDDLLTGRVRVTPPLVEPPP